jgi:hypothetical protein
MGGIDIVMPDKNVLRRSIASQVLIKLRTHNRNYIWEMFYTETTKKGSNKEEV